MGSNLTPAEQWEWIWVNTLNGVFNPSLTIPLPTILSLPGVGGRWLLCHSNQACRSLVNFNKEELLLFDWLCQQKHNIMQEWMTYPYLEFPQTKCKISWSVSFLSELTNEAKYFLGSLLFVGHPTTFWSWKCMHSKSSESQAVSVWLDSTR